MLPKNRINKDITLKISTNIALESFLQHLAKTGQKDISRKWCLMGAVFNIVWVECAPHFGVFKTSDRHTYTRSQVGKIVSGGICTQPTYA